MKKLVPIFVGVAIVLVLVLIPSGTEAWTITFANAWTVTFTSLTSDIPQSNSIVVATGTSDTIVVFAVGNFCTSATGVSFSVSDNGGSAYVAGSTSRIVDCGTNDYVVQEWVAGAAAHGVTSVTVTASGNPLHTFAQLIIVVLAYNGLSRIGSNSGSIPAGTLFQVQTTQTTTPPAGLLEVAAVFNNNNLVMNAPAPGTLRATADAGQFGVSGTPHNRAWVVDSTTVGAPCLAANWCVQSGPSSGSCTGSCAAVAMELRPPAPIVVTSAASVVSTSEATLNANLTLLATETAMNVSFQYGDTISLGNESSRIRMTTVGMFSITVHFLLYKHLYFFRAKATGNETVFGAILNFTTAPLPDVLQTAFNAVWVASFLLVLILALSGAWWLKKRREAGGL